MQLLEVEFVGLLDSLGKNNEPVREVMSWADKCCERLMGSCRANHGGAEERSTMSSRSILIRWGYVTSQVMRDLVSAVWLSLHDGLLNPMKRRFVVILHLALFKF